MDNENTEAKQDFDQAADSILDNAVIGNPEDSSPSNDPESTNDTDPKPAETPGAEPVKPEEIKAVEDDESLSVEDKIAKVKEILGDDEEAVEAYVKEKGYHNDPAWQKREELITKLKEDNVAKSSMSEEDRSSLEEFNKFRSSPEYIQMTMKSQGYTQEKIDAKLQESGFETQGKPQDDVQLVVDKLGIKLDEMEPQEKANTMANISDVIKIAQVLVDDKLSKVLPQTLAPIQDHLHSKELEANANQITNTMKSAVDKDGVLNFDKDIEPELNKFMDENPDALQSDVLNHFEKINHSLTVERLKISGKQADRDEKRSTLRQNIPSSSTPKGMPAKTNDFDKDAAAVFEAHGI